MNRPLLCIIALGVSAASTSAQNLLINGSFESGEFIQDAYYIDRMRVPNDSTAINNWSVGVGDGGLCRWLRSPSFNSQEGDRSVDLDSNKSTPFTYIEQTFSTQIGQQYEISAWFSSEANGGPARTSVLINGTPLGTVTTGSGEVSSGNEFNDLVWTRRYFTFTATGISSTLRFQDATTESFWNPLVDNASVVAVPEPSTVLGLVMSGLLGAAIRLRR